MLIDEYLSTYDVKEIHSIGINNSMNGIYEQMLSCDITSPLIKFLFRIRGMPKDLRRIEDLVRLGFIKLQEQPGKEILFGMLTNNPMFNCCYPNISPSDFIQNSDSSVVKAVINFSLQKTENGNSIISTETRVWCSNKKIRSKFKLYWFFIGPFSQLIRKSMLRQIKKQISLFK